MTMRRQFLRVYVAVAIVLALVQVFAFLSLRRAATEAMDARVVQTLAPTMHLIARRFDPSRGPRRGPPPPPHGRERIVEQIAEHHGLTPRLIPMVDVPAEERAALGGDSVAMVTLDGERWVATPVQDGVLLCMGPIPPPDLSSTARTAAVLMAALLIAIGAAVILGLRPYERRLHRLEAAAQAFGAGRFDDRVSDNQPDAIGAVGRAFDDATERVGRLVAGQRDLLRAVSHELRTPLARLVFMVDELRENTDRDQSRRLDRLDASLEEMRDLVNELLEFGRAADSDGLGVLEPVDVNATALDRVDAARELRTSVDVTLVGGTPVHVDAAPRYLRRALDNLLANAVRHAEKRVVVSVDIDPVARAVSLHVDDDGSGVRASDRARIFEPFARLDGARNRDDGGAGLGLAIARRVARAHGGDIHVGDAPLGGARFTLTLPTRTEAENNT